MSKEVANEDFTMAITKTNAEPGTPTYVIVKAGKASASGKKILVQTITWTMAGCILSGGTFISGLGVMLATAMKTKCDSLAVMRKDDTGLCAGSFQVGSSVTACSCTFKIDNAGQTKAKAV